MLLGGLVSVALLFYTLAGVDGFDVTTSTSNVKVKENEGTDLQCTYTADFGKDARVEWKFKNVKGSQTYVVFDGKPTQPYSSRVTMFGSNIRINKMTANDNGVYNCEVSGNGQFGEAVLTVTVLVPAGKPTCRIPTSVTTDKAATLTCYDGTGSPPPTYRWFRNGTPLPVDPKKIAAFQNSSYTLNPATGELKFTRTSKVEAGEYYCEAVNEAGPPQKCRAMKMEVRDVNTGGIVAGVIVVLLLIALLGFGIWYANKKGYLPRKSEKKPNMVYQPPHTTYGDEEDDGDFKQKSSFVV